jgi:hypothetical protein
VPASWQSDTSRHHAPRKTTAHGGLSNPSTSAKNPRLMAGAVLALDGATMAEV